MRKAIILLVSALILLNFQTAFSLKEKEKENVRKQISSVKAWKLTEELNLSEEQAQSLFPAQKAYEDRKEQLRKKREAVEKELDDLLEAEEKNDERIKEKMTQLKNVDEQSRSNEDQFRAKISKILSVEQQAKYELFEKNFEKELRQMITEIKREKTGLKSRTEEKSQEIQRQPRKAPEEEPRKAPEEEKKKGEPRKKQPEKRASDENRTKKKSPSDEQRSAQERSSREKGSSPERPSREKELSREKSSGESGSSKVKSPQVRRR
jgi:Spy/CpxP family protein refolding chaperone